MFKNQVQPLLQQSGIAGAVERVLKDSAASKKAWATRRGTGSPKAIQSGLDASLGTKKPMIDGHGSAKNSKGKHIFDSVPVVPVTSAQLKSSGMNNSSEYKGLKAKHMKRIQDKAKNDATKWADQAAKMKKEGNKAATKHALAQVEHAKTSYEQSAQTAHTLASKHFRSVF